MQSSVKRWRAGTAVPQAAAHLARYGALGASFWCPRRDWRQSPPPMRGGRTAWGAFEELLQSGKPSRGPVTGHLQLDDSHDASSVAVSDVESGDSPAGCYAARTPESVGNMTERGSNH
eukprot:4863558-Prymnesium_polylepis.2